MRSKKKFRLIRAALLLIAIVCLIPVGQAYYLSRKHARDQKELKASVMEAKQQESGEENGEHSGLTFENEKRQENLQDLYRQNSDMCGWLTIEGTQIDYPVMQSADDSFYLSHNFYKQKDKYGSLFVKETADVNTPGTNFVIYGHNMKDGFMFGSLDNYKDKEFCQEHAKISFDTFLEQRTYKVMAAFETQLTGEGFQYYQFYQADNEEEFLYFYDNVKEMALYDTGIAAEFGDTFLTLSTCSDSGEDIRFVVVAKRIQ